MKKFPINYPFILLLVGIAIAFPILLQQNATSAQKVNRADNETSEDGPSNLLGTISGRVFQDFDGDGIPDMSAPTAAAPAAVDVGIGGLTVAAWDAANVLSGVTVTATSTDPAVAGTYSITTTGTGPYRIEFYGIPAGFTPSARSRSSASGFSSTTSGTTIQFVPEGGQTNVNLALNRQQDYCEPNPKIVSQAYTSGGGAGSNAIFSIPNNAGSTQTTNPANGTEHAAALAVYKTPPETSLATASAVGTTFGLAYHKVTRRIFAAAYFKRHAALGTNIAGATGGTGAIYAVDRNTSTVSEYANLNTIFGANTAGANAHNTADYDADNGNIAWDAVGKSAFGGMTISSDQSKLFVMNLANRTLYELPTTATPTAGNIRSVAFPTTMPNCAAAVDVRPFAVTYSEGLIYVGAVCSAESTNVTTNLRAYVYTVNPTTLTFNTTPVMNFPISYTRQALNGPISATWRTWKTVFTSDFADPFTQPQPMLTDIDFDGANNMVLSFRDRMGDQVGLNTLSNPGSTARAKGQTAGEMLRVCKVATIWTLESNARCGAPATGTGPQGNTSGPGGGEYYFDDNYAAQFVGHDEVALGAASQIPGYTTIVEGMFDPVMYGAGTTFYVLDSGGFRWLDNATGAKTRGYVAYEGFEGAIFGKSNGLGGLGDLCEAAPIEIGSRVWRDLDNDGIQDAGEPPIAGVTVHLYQNGVIVGTAVTNADGEYFFVSSTTPDGNTTDNIGQINGGVLFNTNYEVRFDNPADYASGGPLFGLAPTIANEASAPGDDAGHDSNAIRVNNPVGSPAGIFPVITVTTGGPGANDHTLDAGFRLAPTAASVSVGGAVLTADGQGIKNVSVKLNLSDGSTRTAITGPFGYYRFDDVQAGQSAVISVTAKRFTFKPATQIVSVDNKIGDVNFVSNE